MRIFLSVLAGATLWAALWLASNAAAMALAPGAFEADGALHHAGMLAAFVALSLAFSLAAGWTTARIAKHRTRLAAGILAGLQLSVGLAVEIANWARLSVWYHLLFLALLVPGIVGGAWLAHRGVARAEPSST